VAPGYVSRRRNNGHIRKALHSSDMGAWQKNELNLRAVIPPIKSTDLRSCKADFICRFPDNKTLDEFDHVKAEADGRLRIDTDKASNPNKDVVWSRQPACLLFEVPFFWLDD